MTSETDEARARDARAVVIDRAMTLDLDRRRVLTLARLLPMLSLMAGGQAYEVEGFDAAELHDEVLMALGIEAEDNPQTMAEVIVEMDGDSGHGIAERLERVAPAHPATDEVKRLREVLSQVAARCDVNISSAAHGQGLATEIETLVRQALEEGPAA